MLILQTLLLVTTFYFINTFNVLTVWYLAGIYLVLLGWWLLLDDGDIFVGFLWVIDLGVGLIFFIFILHYSTFLHQKSNLNKTSREFSALAVLLIASWSFFSLIAYPVSNLTAQTSAKSWLFAISWYDYYDLFFSPSVTDLNLLHEIYFTSNSFEFFLINFFLLYGILASVLMTFLIKRIFSFLNYSQLVDYGYMNQARATYFIRNQDYLKQQSTSSGTRVWLKKKIQKFSKSMISKETWLAISDNTNVRWLKVFHLYKGFQRRHSTLGLFVKGSARVVEPPRLEYKGFKFKFNKKGNICRSLLVRCVFKLRRADGSSLWFLGNSGVLIKKKQNIKSKYIQGPTTVNLKRKKFKTLFKTVL